MLSGLATFYGGHLQRDACAHARHQFSHYRNPDLEVITEDGGEPPQGWHDQDQRYLTYKTPTQFLSNVFSTIKARRANNPRLDKWPSVVALAHTRDEIACAGEQLMSLSFNYPKASSPRMQFISSMGQRHHDGHLSSLGLFALLALIVEKHWKETGVGVLYVRYR